ncbi:hypothetical protein SAMN05446037_101748 [Anaerovirgula multivorans]|uniref:Uncharacterized protein n=1 Tax=Anaerovirgula multivorans TaxID=312168 RepID=A0A239GJM3_9FIRM|nr:hypothetical protein SAMN05446037_101748 [Anaerovirgula multivorans]
MVLIEIYKSKYPRHTAFKSGVTQALQTSGLFAKSIPRKGVR